MRHIRIGASTIVLRDHLPELFVAGHATRSFLALVARHVPREADAVLDDLDPFRRVERAYPRLGAEIGATLSLPPLQSAVALLDLASRELGPRVPGWPAPAAAVVRERLSSFGSG